MKKIVEICSCDQCRYMTWDEGDTFLCELQPSKRFYSSDVIPESCPLPEVEEEDEWKDAPEWAEYIATDASGMAYYYEKIPELATVLGMWINGHRMLAKGLNKNIPISYWKTSLKKRSERIKRW